VLSATAHIFGRVKRFCSVGVSVSKGTGCRSNRCGAGRSLRGRSVAVTSVTGNSSSGFRITTAMVKPGAVVVDVGINVREYGAISGDVAFH
jgi:5,10-methylene-tetrahydrofolate dehydrogenase/methenyl tetrahydrofolate cyclohydrolase